MLFELFHLRRQRSDKDHRNSQYIFGFSFQLSYFYVLLNPFLYILLTKTISFYRMIDKNYSYYNSWFNKLTRRQSRRSWDFKTHKDCTISSTCRSVTRKWTLMDYLTFSKCSQPFICVPNVSRCSQKVINKFDVERNSQFYELKHHHCVRVQL